MQERNIKMENPLIISGSYVLSGIDERTANAVNEGLIDQEDVAYQDWSAWQFLRRLKNAEFGGFLFVELLDVQVKGLAWRT